MPNQGDLAGGDVRGKRVEEAGHKRNRRPFTADLRSSYL